MKHITYKIHNDIHAWHCMKWIHTMGQCLQKGRMELWTWDLDLQKRVSSGLSGDVHNAMQCTGIIIIGYYSEHDTHGIHPPTHTYTPTHTVCMLPPQLQSQHVRLVSIPCRSFRASQSRWVTAQIIKVVELIRLASIWPAKDHCLHYRWLDQSLKLMHRSLFYFLSEISWLLFWRDFSHPFAS